MNPDFIIVPTPDPAETLFSFFPELRDILHNSEGPYYLYDRFADYLLARNSDVDLWRRAFDLFDAMASGSLELPSLLAISLVESLQEDTALLDRIAANCGAATRRILNQTRTQSQF